MSTRSRQNLKFFIEYNIIRDVGRGQNGLRPSRKNCEFMELSGTKHLRWLNGRISDQLTQREIEHCQNNINLHEEATSVLLTANNIAVAVHSDVTTDGVPDDAIWSSIGFDDSQGQIKVQYAATQNYHLRAGQNSSWSRLIPPGHIPNPNTGNESPRPLAGPLAVIIGLAILSNPASPNAVLASGFRNCQDGGRRYWGPVSVNRIASIGVVVRIYTYNTPPTAAGSNREELRNLCSGNTSLGPIFDL